jgi:fibronectin-binding autotransporter adhesin
MGIRGLRFAAMATVACTVLALAATANAGTTYYWYGSDATLGGAGTWDTGVTTNTAWGQTIGGTDTYWLNTAACDADFGGAASGVVTCATTGVLQVGSITLNTAGYRFNSGTISTGGGIVANYSGSVTNTIVVQNSQSWTIASGCSVEMSNGVIYGATGNTLTLDNANGTITGAGPAVTSGGMTTNLKSGTITTTGMLRVGRNVTGATDPLSTFTVDGGVAAGQSVNVGPRTSCRVIQNDGLVAMTLYMLGGDARIAGTSNSYYLNGGIFSGGTGSAATPGNIVNRPEPTMNFYFNGGLYYYGGTRALDNGTRWNTSNLGTVTYSVQSKGARFEIANSAGSIVFACLQEDGASPGGGVTKTGLGILVLSGASTYTGLTSVDAGTLALKTCGSSLTGETTGVLGSIAASAGVKVAASAIFDVLAYGSGGWTLGASQTLSGAGTVNGNVNANGTVAPGSSPATLTIAGILALGSGASLSYELCGTDKTVGGGVNDLIQSVTDLTLDGTLNVTETVANSFLSANVGDKWTLITYGGALSDSGLSLGAMPALSGTRYFAVEAGGGQVNLVVVPEPGTLALLASSLLGLIAYAWRKRK